MSTQMVTFEAWRKENPERWAQIEGTITRSQLRTLKFLDAQIHLSRHFTENIAPPETPEVGWLRRCVTVYLYVMGQGLFPKNEPDAMWVKNQRRASLCDYQVAAVQQFPGWRWQPRRTDWDRRVADLNAFREHYGREPRVRSGWGEERALAHWNSRQRQAMKEGKLSPNQTALLEGETGLPTGELVFRLPSFAGSYADWFREFWTVTVPKNHIPLLSEEVGPAT